MQCTSPNQRSAPGRRTHHHVLAAVPEQLRCPLPWRAPPPLAASARPSGVGCLHRGGWRGFRRLWVCGAAPRGECRCAAGHREAPGLPAVWAGNAPGAREPAHTSWHGTGRHAQAITCTRQAWEGGQKAAGCTAASPAVHALPPTERRRRSPWRGPRKRRREAARCLALIPRPYQAGRAMQGRAGAPAGPKPWNGGAQGRTQRPPFALTRLGRSVGAWGSGRGLHARAAAPHSSLALMLPAPRAL